MFTTASRPFVYSTLLHVAVAGLGLLLMLKVRPVPTPEPDRVIVMVPDSPLAPSGHDSPVRAATAPSVRFTPAPPRVVESAPERLPVEQTPVVQTPVTPRTRAPEAERAPATGRTTIGEHRRLHPRPGDAGRAPVPVPVPGSHIDVGAVLAEGAPRATPPSAGGDEAAANTYFEQLVARLRAAHVKPAGLDDGLQARVEFTVRADGSVADARILQSSGDAAFDASVLAAFGRLANLGKLPAGMTGVRQITFRTCVE